VKAFLVSIALLAAVALGWNYWVMHRSAAVPRGIGSTSGAAGGIPGGNPGRGGRGFGGRPAGPTTSVTGTVRMAGGVAHSAHVDLVRVGPTGAGRVYAGEEALGDGRFTFPRVMADRYWVVASAEVDADPMRPGDGPVRHFFGTSEVVSDGEHPGHVGVQLFPGSTMSGRVTLVPFPASAAKDLELMAVTLAPVDAGTRAAIATGDASSSLTADGVFTIDDVPPGRYALEVSGSSWALDTVIVADHDRLDRPFQIGTGEHLTASVTLTNHPNEVVGTLRDGAGRALPFALVTVFAIDGDQRDAHRRVQLVRTDAKGAFRFEGLPSGDYLLAPAGGFDPPTWRTVEFFARLTPIATRISLRGGLRRTQDLTATAAR
jgi:hypothetical protein